jgi:hypothetical protein
MDPDDLERALPNGFGRPPTGFAARQPDERDGPSLARPFTRAQYGVLPDRTKIWWQPIANINEPLRHRWVRAELSFCWRCSRSNGAQEEAV